MIENDYERGNKCFGTGFEAVLALKLYRMGVTRSGGQSSSLDQNVQFHWFPDGNWLGKCSWMLVYPFHIISDAESDFYHSYSEFEKGDFLLKTAIFRSDSRNFICCYR